MNKCNLGTGEKNTSGGCVTNKNVRSLSTGLNNFEVDRSLCLQTRMYFVVKTKCIWLHDCISKQRLAFLYLKNRKC